jgi:hypothetical protein
VSPTGQHQWYELTSGVQKCLSCLTPMDETPAHMEPVAVNDAHAIDAA